jgi:hypothetical protein
MLAPIIASLLLAFAIVATPDSAPHMTLEKPAVTAYADTSGFAIGRLQFYNTGGGTLTVTGVKGSCACASASVQRATAVGMEAGEIRWGVNAKHLKDSVNNVDFTIHHTGDNSPTMFRVVVIKPLAKDTL